MRDKAFLVDQDKFWKQMIATCFFQYQCITYIYTYLWYSGFYDIHLLCIHMLFQPIFVNIA